MKEISLTRGKTAFVDDEDYERLSKYRWWAMTNGYGWYAFTEIDGKTTYMHRLILPNLKQIDHRNRNGLDNRKQNLRSSNDRLNQGNQSLHKNKKSKFKGVYPSKNGKWKASIRYDGRTRALGTFKTEENAALAYDAEAKIAFGEFACTNQMLGLLTRK